mmetsp:Transcript_68716/g.121404  ORF Transcript_68716/g.121404 Transcript_68716/m.121404 type:complete len:111 (-) Transcript_68716:26-358(-)
MLGLHMVMKDLIAEEKEATNPMPKAEKAAQRERVERKAKADLKCSLRLPMDGTDQNEAVGMTKAHEDQSLTMEVLLRRSCMNETRHHQRYKDLERWQEHLHRAMVGRNHV